LLLVFLVVVVEMRSAPADIGTLAYGETGGQVTSGQASANNPIPEPIAALAAGLRSKDFWLLAGSFFICGASTTELIGTHLVPACMDRGIPEVQAAGFRGFLWARLDSDRAADGSVNRENFWSR